MTKGNSSAEGKIPLAALEELIKRHTRAAADHAVSTGGQIAEEQIEALERLNKLAEACRAVESASGMRLGILALLAITLLIPSVLLYSRMQSVEIEWTPSIGSEFSARRGQR